MEQPITTAETLADVPDVSTPDGGTADSQEAVSLAKLLSQELGKQVPTDEAALKAVKDTFSYVGKTGKFLPFLDQLQSKLGGEQQVLKFMEDIVQNPDPQTSQPDPELTSKVESLERAVKDSNFYAQHPEYNTPDVKALISKLGSDPEAVIADEVFKGAYEAMKAQREFQESKSVLHTNPRIGQVTDKLSQAAQLKDTDPAQARTLATQAVLDAYES
jgi:hypothetical protein